MKNSLFLSAAVLALGLTFTAAANAGVSGTLSGSYADDTDGSSGSLWNINGSLTGMVAQNWGLEGTGGYHNLDLGSGLGSLDIWNVGGSAFWAGMQGRLAATVHYYSTSEYGADLNVTSYGAGGEWYLGPQFTVAVKGGGNTISASAYGYGDSASGGYVGGMLQWYLMPNLSLSGSVDYTEFSGIHTTNETAKLEWMFSDSMPLSIYGGYEHADASLDTFGGSSDGNGNAFFVGLKFYFNSPTGGSLVDRQRNGSLGYIAEVPVFGQSTN